MESSFNLMLEIGKQCVSRNKLSCCLHGLTGSSTSHDYLLKSILYSSNKNVWCGLNTKTVVCFNSRLMENVSMCLLNVINYSKLITYGV